MVFMAKSEQHYYDLTTTKFPVSRCIRNLSAFNCRPESLYENQCIFELMQNPNRYETEFHVRVEKLRLWQTSLKVMRENLFT